MKEVQGVALQNEAAKVFWNKTISHGRSRRLVSRSSIQGVQKFSVTGCQGGDAGVTTVSCPPYPSHAVHCKDIVRRKRQRTSTVRPCS